MPHPVDAEQPNLFTLIDADRENFSTISNYTRILYTLLGESHDCRALQKIVLSNEMGVDNGRSSFPATFGEIKSTNQSVEGFSWVDGSTTDMRAVFAFVCLGGGLLMDWIGAVLGQAILGPVGLLALGFAVPEVAYSLFPDAEKTYAAFFEQYTWSEMPWSIVMLALLPILIFDSAFNIKYFEFKKHFPEIMALALPCFVVGFAILGVVLYYSVVVFIGYDKWTLFVCFMYSAMISATDPVAVVMLLSKLNVPHRLRLLLEGESLLNDGMALILYSITDALVRDQLGHPDPRGLLLTIVYLLLHVLTSVLIGWLLASAAGYAFTKTTDGVRQRSIILLFVYVAYLTCETIHGSGILGVVAYALVLNSHRSKMSSSTNRYNVTQWKVFAFWANSILFLLTGLLASKNYRRSLTEDRFSISQLLGIFLWTYVAAFLSRFLSLALYSVLTGLQCRFSKWFFPWSYTVMLTWSGLRGSIALLLAIRTNDEDLFGQIAPLACGCVAFTVLVTNFYHTFTATATATILNLTQLSQTKKKRIKLLIKDINAFVKSVRDTYVNAQMGFWNEVLWGKVEQLSTMEHELEEHAKGEQDSSNVSSVAATMKVKRDGKSQKQENTEKEMSSRLVIMNMMSAHTLFLGERRIMSNVAVQYMTNAINEAMDQGRALNVEDLHDRLQPYDCMRRLSALSSSLICRLKNGLFESRPQLQAWLLGSHVKKSRGSEMWNFLWYILAIGHIATVAVCYNLEDNPTLMYYHLLFIQLIMCLLFAAEIWIRRHMEDYRDSAKLGQCYDVLMIVLYLLSAVSVLGIAKTSKWRSELKTSANEDWSSLMTARTKNQIFRYANASSALFEIFYFPFWFLYLAPRILANYLQQAVADADRVCFELMHSIILISEHVMEKLQQATSSVVQDSEEIRQKLEAENLEMSFKASTRMINIINSTNRNSNWVIYIKTMQVSQMILCEAMDTVEKDFSTGIIDRDSYKSLQKELREKIEKVNQMTEESIVEPSFAECLENMSWIESSSRKDDLIKFICENSIKKEYEIGQYIVKQGENADGAYFIKRGICRFMIRTDKAKPQPKHLIYAGQFTGEKAFLAAMLSDSRAPFVAPKRSGSIYAETYVVAYFVRAKHALHLLQIDPSISDQFEEEDVLNRCRDFLRQISPFSNYTSPALDTFIKKNWQIFDRSDKTKKISEGCTLILLKGHFIVDDFTRFIESPTTLQGPRGPVGVRAAPRRRCFILTYFDDYKMQQAKEREEQQMQKSKSTVSGDRKSDPKIFLSSSNNTERQASAAGYLSSKT